MTRNRKSQLKQKTKREKRLTVQGPWGTSFSMPLGRLPIAIGNPNFLSSEASIYPNMVKLDVPIFPQFFNVSSGALAQTIPIDVTQIPAFSSRFPGLFNELCVVGARYHFKLTNVTNPQGVVVVTGNEKSSSAPGSSCLDQPHMEIDIQYPDTEDHIYEWVARDYLDLQWAQSSSSTTPAYVKLYAANTPTGTGASTSCQVQVTGELSLCFRGYTPT
jgi:hypothetical protein